MDLAELDGLIPSGVNTDSFDIPDEWTKTKRRKALTRFRKPVLERSDHACIVCGTSLRGLVDAAHLNSWADDKANRANPANGVCLCKYCHRTFDLCMIAITPSGELLVSSQVQDHVALHHFDRVMPDKRVAWLNGVEPAFLKASVDRYYDAQTSAPK